MASHTRTQHLGSMRKERYNLSDALENCFIFLLREYEWIHSLGLSSPLAEPLGGQPL